MGETAISLILLLAVAAVVFIAVHFTKKNRSIKKAKKSSNDISAADVAVLGSVGISWFLKKISSAVKVISGKIWHSKRRWLWIGIIAFLVFAYGRTAYISFFTDEGLGIKTARIMNFPDGHKEIIFEIPESVKYKRIEILESVGIRNKSGEVVGFEFPNATMREYTLPGQKGIDRFLNKIFKPLFGMPFQKEEDYEGLEYKSHKAKKGEAVIFKGSEIEWNKPPYIIIAKTKGNKFPFELSIQTKPLRYQVVDQKSLGKIDSEQKK
jgi:hypothetical protein